MASASQRLETIIAINAEVGNGFSQVGSTLTQMGALVDGISQQLIDFGRESIEVYRDYEKSMTDAEVALSTTYGQNSKELKAVMADLDLSATQWAASTKFHTNDVANAISEAAHAGWDYDKIINGIPAAMELASAGSLDLSEAVNYVVKATNAAGIEFKDTGEFIDLWTYAANSSASTISEFGEAMLRMGNTMRFAADPEELMTLIAVTANAGSVGSEAGTLIRNSILRLVAPTQKANEVMEELGATSEETAGLMEDQALQAANARLEAEGFSAYDENGNLKSVLDTYRDLYVALQDIAGGYGDIAKNEETLQILSAIFPTRTITEALTLLRGAEDSYGNLYEDMKNGAAKDYGEYAAERMLDTLDGRIEIFGSKLERLKQITGEALSEDLSNFLAGAGDIIDNIAELDDGKFNMLVKGGEALAAAGPGLLAAGSAFRLIGTIVGSKAAMIGTFAIAATTLATAMKEMSDLKFEDNFGTAELDQDALNEYMNSLLSGYENAYTEANAFRQEVDKSLSSYQQASSAFTSDLLTDLVTNATLSDADIAKFESLGEDMQNAVLTGLRNSTDASWSYWEVLVGDGDNDLTEDIYGALQYQYDQSIAEAEKIGQGLRDAMNSAFADGQISDEEYQNILSYVQSYNEAMAKAAQEATDRENQIYYQEMIHKSQTASEKEMEQFTKDIRDKTDSILADEQEQYESERAALIVDYNKAIEDGIEFRGGAATEERLNELLAELDAKFEARYLEISEQRDEAILDMWQSQTEQSGLSDAYNSTMELVDQVLSGNMEADAAVETLKNQYGANPNAGETDWGAAIGNPSTRNQLSEVFARMIDGIGGYDQLRKKILDYEDKGDYENANRLKNLWTAQALVDNFAEVGVEDASGLWKMIPFFGDDAIKSSAKGLDREQQAGRSDFENTVAYGEGDFSPEGIRNTINLLGNGSRSITEFLNSLEQAADGTVNLDELNADYWHMTEANRDQLGEFVSQLKDQFDFGQIIADAPEDTITARTYNGVSDFYAADQILYGDIDPEQYRIQVTPEIDESAMQELGPYPVEIVPHTEGEDSVSELQEQGVNVQVDGDTQQLEASIDGATGQTLIEYVDGDATDLSMSIYEQDGKTLIEHVTGNTTDLANAISRYNNQTITVNIQGRKMFAAGGRATEASVFGEAGPEWAIPEEHTARTADLLNAAREASGFTWPDLLARYGGFNANANNSPSALVYSPVINATNADGVEKVLQDDKERLDKWYREKKALDELEVYS